MERRIAIKQMALAAGGLLAIPGWANAWTKTSVQISYGILKQSQAETLAEVVDTLIPASDSLGAKGLGVPDFVQKMIADCYEPAAQESFKKGLDTVDVVAKESFNQPFLTCDATQRAAVLQKLATAPEADRKDFYSLVKNLTIQGFTTSEYVMTKFLNYQMIPGHYYGCVPVPTKAVSQTK
ncbi:gluconate 2-dehydrogenase subunit 3 family protein [Spirosoma soli]|uniref:Gluconate 2-dehydrogenase subunit 3 family protein n=1 Tax=Spirosoma soli TaxID=1770529 RepID=A0ABW5LXX6_9BACT